MLGLTFDELPQQRNQQSLSCMNKNLGRSRLTLCAIMKTKLSGRIFFVTGAYFALGCALHSWSPERAAPLPLPPLADAGPSVDVRAESIDLSASSAPLPPCNISFDNVRFEMKKGVPFNRQMLSPEIEKLDGKNIRIRGWILPGGQATGLTDFVLVRDNQECCFGPMAALFDCMIVKMDNGKATNFTTRPVAIDGIFDIREQKFSDGTLMAIYHLTAKQVK